MLTPSEPVGAIFIQTTPQHDPPQHPHLILHSPFTSFKLQPLFHIFYFPSFTICPLFSILHTPFIIFTSSLLSILHFTSSTFHHLLYLTLSTLHPPFSILHSPSSTLPSTLHPLFFSFHSSSSTFHLLLSILSLYSKSVFYSSFPTPTFTLHFSPPFSPHSLLRLSIPISIFSFPHSPVSNLYLSFCILHTPLLTFHSPCVIHHALYSTYH